MARAELKWNPDFFDDLGHDPGLSGMLQGVASGIAARARGAAPFDPDRRKGQHYRDSITVERGDEDDRASFDVVASAPHAVAVESRHGVLARAIGG